MRLARPAGQALDVDERLVLLAGDPDLLHELDRVDAGRIRREPQVGDRVEELEPNAPLLQDLVEGREDGVAHARLHLVHERAAEAEDEPQQVVGGRAGGEVGLGDVAVGVGEGDVIDRAQHR